MKSEWLQHAVLRAASFLTPGEERGEWLAEWRSELWYVPRRDATRFCLGAFRDAFWMRRNHASQAKRPGSHLTSPVACLAFLAMVAAVSLAIAARLPGLERPARAPSGSLLDGYLAMLLLSCVTLPPTLIAMGTGVSHYPMPWGRRLRRWTFLGLKIALLQPVMLCGFVLAQWLGTAVPFAIWTLAFRWVIVDQQRRCPVCLRLLTEPVRIGSASQTFLEWYGSESVCSRGHGLLHTSEMPFSYSGRSHWLCLGDSWSGLFSQAAGVRQK